MRRWTEAERRKNAVDIMRGNIERDPVGSKLTDAAKERAAEFAADVWQGNMGNGQASEIGIQHVTGSIFKK